MEIIESNDLSKTKLALFLPNADIRWSNEIKPTLIFLQKGYVKSLSELSIYFKKFAKYVNLKPYKPTSGLEELYKNSPNKLQAFLIKILPFIASCALKIETFYPNGRIPVLSKKQKLGIKISREQISSLIACSFLLLVPDRQPNITMIDYSMLQFHENSLYGNMSAYKLASYIEYFIQLLKNPRIGDVFILRNNIEKGPIHVQYSQSKKPLTKVIIKDTGSIADEHNALIIDFANKFVGGGCMESGCVQEELMFLEQPELLVSRFFNEVMSSQDAILIKGTEIFVNIQGYGQDFTFSGYRKDPLTMTNIPKIINRDIIAVDALDLRGSPKYTQYLPESILREIAKLHSGISIPLIFNKECKKPLSTGRWGCGAFLGNSQLKFLTQWLVAAENGIDMIFYRRDDKYLKNAENIVKFCEKFTVSELYEKLNKIYTEIEKTKGDVFNAIMIK